MTKYLSYIGSAVFIHHYYSQKLQAKEMVACHECHMKRLPKAKELPIYDNKDNYTIEYDTKSTSQLMSDISIVRKFIYQYASYVNTYQEQVANVYRTGIAHSKSTFDYLKDEENKIQRYMIIASGGLFGLLCARKGGIFKKIVYPTVGAGAVFSAFYPSLSKEYIFTGWNLTTNQVNYVLVNYGGYDTEKWGKVANERIEYIKSAMKFEGLMDKMNEMFHKDKNIKELKDEKNKDSSSKNMTKDQDMYTTRSAN